MSIGMLGMVAAGGAKAYADQERDRVNQENQVKLAIFSAEMQDAFAQRREERAAMQEGKLYTRGRTDALTDAASKAERDDLVAGRTEKHDLNKLEVSHGYTKELEEVKQKGLDTRASMRETRADARATTRANAPGLLKAEKTVDPYSTPTRKRLNAIQDQQDELKLKLNDVMVPTTAEQKTVLKEQIKRLVQESKQIRLEAQRSQLPDEPTNIADLYKQKTQQSTDENTRTRVRTGVIDRNSNR